MLPNDVPPASPAPFHHLLQPVLHPILQPVTPQPTQIQSLPRAAWVAGNMGHADRIQYRALWDNSAHYLAQRRPVYFFPQEMGLSIGLLEMGIMAENVR